MASSTEEAYEDDFVTDTSASSAVGAAEISIDELSIGKKLGGGGFAVVFLAKWRGQHVAAKILVDPKISDDLRREFMDELHVMK
jgi:serine/threonine protein kinase